MTKVACVVVAMAASSALQEGFELVAQFARAMLALAGVVIAVEDRALLGIDQPRAGARRLDLGGAERHRDARLVQMQLVADDNPLVLDDVPIGPVIGVHRAARRPAADAFLAADAEIRPVVRFLPIL